MSRLHVLLKNPQLAELVRITEAMSTTVGKDNLVAFFIIINCIMYCLFFQNHYNNLLCFYFSFGF